MHVTRYLDAPVYDAPGHSGMRMRRLQGREAGPSDTTWIGCSELEPGGGTTASASDVEKFYVCLEGHVQVTSVYADQTTVVDLHPNDSCRIAPGESRQLLNTTSETAKLLLVMPISRA
jgi:mannose-6-phosphate isomerase-like protein (cupin superfamily)